MNTNNLSFKLKVIALLAAGLLTSACSEKRPPTASAPEAQAWQAVERAREQYEASKTAGHAWIKTGKLLTGASEALEAGNFPAALSLAQQAETLAQASLAQAKAEQEAWRQRLPKPPAEKQDGK